MKMGDRAVVSVCPWKPLQSGDEPSLLMQGTYRARPLPDHTTAANQWQYQVVWVKAPERSKNLVLFW